MEKTIWYGAKDNNVQFANSQNVLKDQGIHNPRSFTTTGNVTGLVLADDSSSTAGSNPQCA